MGPRPGWGSVARHGANALHDDRPSSPRGRPSGGAAIPWEPEEWLEVDESTAGPVRRSVADGPSGGRRPLPAQVAAELADAGGRQAPRLAERLADAHRAFSRDRFIDARRMLVALAEAAPDSPTVRELLGLTCYRLGQWRAAVRELDAWATQTGETRLHPFLADAHRALGHHAQVARLWDELRQASPDAATVAEGRIVAAGSLADRGDLAGAIALLEAGRHRSRHPEDHHLRIWYALADLYERAGELPRARDLFERVAAVDPDFVDVRQRRRSLG